MLFFYNLLKSSVRREFSRCVTEEWKGSSVKKTKYWLFEENNQKNMIVIGLRNEKFR